MYAIPLAPYPITCLNEENLSIAIMFTVVHKLDDDPFSKMFVTLWFLYPLAPISIK